MKSECLKLASEMVKKPICLACQVTPSSSQICKEVQKPCCGKGPGWLSFLDECPKYFFFQLPNQNQILLGGWTGSCAPGDRKVQNGSSVALHALSHSMLQRLQNVYKKQKDMPVTEILNRCTRYRNKHLKISCKNKVLIKSYRAWN